MARIRGKCRQATFFPEVASQAISQGQETWAVVRAVELQSGLCRLEFDVGYGNLKPNLGEPMKNRGPENAFQHRGLLIESKRGEVMAQG